MSMTLHDDLVREALAYILAAAAEHPKTPLPRLLDEAGMRFNLSPLDAERLTHLLEPFIFETRGVSMHHSDEKLHFRQNPGCVATTEACTPAEQFHDKNAPADKCQKCGPSQGNPQTVPGARA